MHLIRSSPWLRCQKKPKKLWKTKKMPIFLSHTLALTSFCSIFQFLEHCEVLTIPQWTFPKFEKCENDAMALGDIICYKKYVRLHSTMQCLQYWLHSAFQLCVGKVNRNSGKVHTTTIFLNIILTRQRQAFGLPFPRRSCCPKTSVIHISIKTRKNHVHLRVKGWEIIISYFAIRQA